MSNDPTGPDVTPGHSDSDSSERHIDSAPAPEPQPRAARDGVRLRGGCGVRAAGARAARARLRPPSRAQPPVYAEPADRYADVPASLELAYTTADLGLSPRRVRARLPVRVACRGGAAAPATRARRVGRELAETVILALLIFFAVKAVVQNFRVEGASMEPSLQTDQYLLVNKAIYFRVDMDRIHKFLPFIPGDDGASGTCSARRAAAT